MSKRSYAALVVILLAALALSSGCGSRDEGLVVARIGHETITNKELMSRLGELPVHNRQQYGTPEGMIELLEKMVEEETLFQAALEGGYDADPEITRAMSIIRRRMMIEAYYRNEIDSGVEVPEEDILAYYEEYGEQFPRPASIRLRHVMTETRSEADRVRRRILAGEDIASVAREVSTDGTTRESGGLTKSIKAGGEIRRLGMDSEFIGRLFDWKVGEITEPLRSEKGWHVVKLEEKLEAGTRPLEEVRDTIVRTLRPGKVAERYDSVAADLKKRFRATINEDALRPKPRTEEELFSLAQETEDPLKRMNHYAELVYNYPDGEHAAEAQFMIGFIHAEELDSIESAERAFRKMLEDYPDAELAESARWMLENAGTEAPAFEDSGEVTPQ